MKGLQNEHGRVIKDMRFYRKDFDVYQDWITILPTIVIHIDNPVYVESNISIEFHWLIFHVRFMWMKK